MIAHRVAEADLSLQVPYASFSITAYISQLINRANDTFDNAVAQRCTAA